MLRRRARLLVLIARWAIALFGWAAAVRMWERRYPRPGPNVRIHSDAVDAIDAAVRDLGHDCRARALAGLALLRSSGMEAELKVGSGSHAWVECGPRVLGDRDHRHA